MAKKQQLYQIKHGVGILLFLFLTSLFIMGCVVKSPVEKASMDDFFLNDDLDSSNDQDARETFTISGVGQVENIYHEGIIKIIASGVDNVINVHKDTKVSKITVSGTANIIYLCNGVHSPQIDKSGVANQVVYNDC